MKRCGWVNWADDDGLMTRYHDKEWGFPVHNDRKLFEFLVLESAQAGLSWSTVLKKRENYRKAFHGFNFERISRYRARDIKRLLGNAGIIRNRLKISATINNAKRFIEIRKEFGTFDRYMRSFVKKPIRNNIRSMQDIPANTPLSDRISKDMKKRGFKFMGSTIVYAHMQATGLVNDHENTCFRKKI
jgi:DNA-3-methyladenine glycosylase I